MKFTDFASLIRLKTGTDANTFTDANILLLANIYKNVIAAKIVKENEDYFGLDLTTGLVAGQREYPMPDNLIQVKLVEAKLNGTDWERLLETDYNFESFTTDEAAIVAAFNGRDSGWEYFRNSIWILNGAAITTVADGLKLKAIIYPADFTNLALTTDMAANPSSTSHGWPITFQELLARRVIIEYKTSRDKPITLSELEQKYAYDLEDALTAIRNPNMDRSVKATVPYNDGSEY